MTRFYLYNELMKIDILKNIYLACSNLSMINLVNKNDGKVSFQFRFSFFNQFRFFPLPDNWKLKLFKK
jgi:hypothetical protein